ncbi:hypothetical protein RRG08_001796 [Elysia crispata]|uniref:Uncharacterized protein n=1 Tax=Elysia crispata TaxID=231223 RepID=A0AAE1ANE1_9GAST|nr:hypothetical protein RRG08_001796 [Elysia crispata]
MDFTLGTRERTSNRQGLIWKHNEEKYETVPIHTYIRLAKDVQLGSSGFCFTPLTPLIFGSNGREDSSHMAASRQDSWGWSKAVMAAQFCMLITLASVAASRVRILCQPSWLTKRFWLTSSLN